MRAYWRLPESLQTAAYCAGSEYAWRQDHALLVIQNLTQRRCAVIGIEVWLATEPGPTIPTPFVYAWEADSYDAAESWSLFVERVNNQAASYIENFVWYPDDKKHTAESPYFNLTVLEEPPTNRGNLLMPSTC